MHIRSSSAEARLDIFSSAAGESHGVGYNKSVGMNDNISEGERFSPAQSGRESSIFSSSTERKSWMIPMLY